MKRVSAMGLCLAGFAAVVAGCGQNRSSAPSPAVAGSRPELVPPGEAWSETGPFAAGKKVMAAGGCGRCHTVNGVRPAARMGPMAGGPGGPKGGFGPPEGFKGGGPRPGNFGPGGPGKRPGRAPDLGHTAKDPAHTVDWFVQYVSNPTSLNAEARMPRFEGRISADDMHKLAEYLASLK
jgi:mono/diheme cytochrome c family protein